MTFPFLNNNNVHSLTRDANNKNKRYEASIFVILSQGCLLLVITYLIILQQHIAFLIALLIVLLASFFAYKWVIIHSVNLTRKNRPFWNEANILETYQVRARLKGHFFMPDPATPGPNERYSSQKNGKEDIEEIRLEEATFEKNRSSHYKNEFKSVSKKSN